MINARKKILHAACHLSNSGQGIMKPHRGPEDGEIAAEMTF